MNNAFFTDYLSRAAVFCKSIKHNSIKNTFDPVNNIDALAVDFLLIFTALVMLLLGCASVPEDVKTNNKNTENNSCETDAVRSTLTEALENSSDIYNNDYKQIKIAEGPDLDFSGVSGVMDYTLSAAAWNDDDIQKVLAFFNKEGLYGETVSKEQGTAIDGEWVQYSDGENTVTMDCTGYVAYDDNSSFSSDAVMRNVMKKSSQTASIHLMK